MRETTAQISAFCREQGLGTMRGRGGSAAALIRAGGVVARTREHMIVYEGVHAVTLIEVFLCLSLFLPILAPSLHPTHSVKADAWAGW